MWIINWMMYKENNLIEEGGLVVQEDRSLNKKILYELRIYFSNRCGYAMEEFHKQHQKKRHFSQYFITTDSEILKM